MSALPPPGLIDVGALAFVALAAVRGYFRGLSRQLATLLALAVGLVAGIRLYPAVGTWVDAHTRLDGRAADAAAFIALVLAVLMGMTLLRGLLGAVIRVVVDERVDRPLGVLGGVLGGLLLVLLLGLTAVLVPSERLNTLVGGESLVGAWIERQLPRLQELVETLDARDALPTVPATKP